MAIGDPKVIDKGSNKDINQMWEDSFYSMYSKSKANIEYVYFIILKYSEEENIKNDIDLEMFKELRIDNELMNFEY